MCDWLSSRISHHQPHTAKVVKTYSRNSHLSSWLLPLLLLLFLFLFFFLMLCMPIIILKMSLSISLRSELLLESCCKSFLMLSFFIRSVVWWYFEFSVSYDDAAPHVVSFSFFKKKKKKKKTVPLIVLNFTLFFSYNFRMLLHCSLRRVALVESKSFVSFPIFIPDPKPFRNHVDWTESF